MFKIFFLIFSISILIQACQQNKNKNEVIDSLEQKEETIHIDLNNGKKWEVVPKMMLIIRSMEAEINNFKGSNLNQFAALATTLSAKITELTSNCTMQGKAHDELHKWLVPFIEKVEEFAVIKSEKEGKVFVTTFKEDFSIFNTYFN